MNHGYLDFVKSGTDLSNEIIGSYNLWVVALSLIIACAAAFTALQISERLTRTSQTRIIWHSAGALAMGCGIWSMHFVGMLAFKLPVVVNYDVGITLLSLIPGILASAVALHFISRDEIDFWRANLGGVLMGVGIGTMHYTGMAAMISNAQMLYYPGLFALSILVAHVLATLAIYVKFVFAKRYNHSLLGQLLGAVLMGFAVAGMHYTGMAAAVHLPAPNDMPVTQGIAEGPLGNIVAFGTALILMIAIISAMVDRRLERAGAALRNSEVRAEVILNSIGDGLIEITTDWIIKFVNPAACHLLGKTREELLGSNIASILKDGLDTSEIANVIKGLPPSGTQLTHLIGPANKEIPVQYSVQPLFIDHVIEGAIVSFGDISELLAAQQASENASIAKSHFLANMSHEIRTPMNGVLGMASLLTRTKLDDTQKEYAKTIESSAESLLVVINDILDFSKIEAGKLEIEEGPFNLQDALRDVCDLLLTNANEKNIEIILSYPPDAQMQFIGDVGRIRQIVTNLAGNAVKFTEQGHVEIIVKIGKVISDRAAIEIYVRDTGIGIQNDRLEGIFEKFEQADSTTTRKFGGTGLGLSISKNLAELMDGDLSATSEVGKGSEFKLELSLPYHHGKIDTIAAEDLTGKRALIIDDNPVNLRVLTDQLQHWGIKVIESISADQADLRLQEALTLGQTFDFVIVDFQMPERSGVDFAVKLRSSKEFFSLPVILLSSVTAVSETEDFERAEFIAQLMKPARPLQLQRALALAVNQNKGKSTPDAVDETQATTTPEPSNNANKDVQILIVDDTWVNISVAKAILKNLGYTADTASDGDEAVKMVELIDYDIVLMDCHMPNMDGYEATKIIRSKGGKYTNLVIIAMTAGALKSDVDRSLQAGMNDHLSKPISLDSLNSKLEKWLPSNAMA